MCKGTTIQVFAFSNLPCLALYHQFNVCLTMAVDVFIECGQSHRHLLFQLTCEEPNGPFLHVSWWLWVRSGMRMIFFFKHWVRPVDETILPHTYKTCIWKCFGILIKENTFQYLIYNTLYMICANWTCYRHLKSPSTQNASINAISVDKVFSVCANKGIQLNKFVVWRGINIIWVRSWNCGCLAT